MSDVLSRLYENLGDDLNRIRRRFKNPKVTLIVRNPDLNDGDIVIGDDDFESAIAAIKKLTNRQKAAKS